MCRILRHTEHAHLEMQMRPGRAAGRPDRADSLAPLDQHAGFDLHDGQVGIARGQAVAVIDIDQIAVFRMIGGREHHAIGRDDDRRAGFGGEIEALVHGAHTGDRIGTVAENRPQGGILDRQGGRQQAILDTFLEQLEFEEAEIIGSPFDLAGQAVDFRLQLDWGQHRDERPPLPWLGQNSSGLRLALDSGQPGNPIAHGVQLQHAGLQFAQAGCHQLQIVVEVITGFPGFLKLQGNQQVFNKRQAQMNRQPGKKGRSREDQHQE